MPAGVRYPTPPAPGEPIRATLLRDIIDCLKRITPLAGKNTTVDYGPYGARVNGTPGGKGGGVPAKADRGTWRIETIQIDNPEGGTPEKVDRHVFRHCYYMSGCVPKSFDPTEGVPEGEHEIYIEDKVKDLPEEGSVVFAFKFRPDGIYNDSDPGDKAKIFSEADFSTINELSKDVSWCVFPLYEIDNKLNVVVDFRGMPVAPLIEEGVGV